MTDNKKKFNEPDPLPFGIDSSLILKRMIELDAAEGVTWTAPPAAEGGGEEGGGNKKKSLQPRFATDRKEAAAAAAERRKAEEKATKSKGRTISDLLFEKQEAGSRRKPQGEHGGRRDRGRRDDEDLLRIAKGEDARGASWRKEEPPSKFHFERGAKKEKDAENLLRIAKGDPSTPDRSKGNSSSSSSSAAPLEFFTPPSATGNQPKTPFTTPFKTPANAAASTGECAFCFEPRGHPGKCPSFDALRRRTSSTSYLTNLPPAFKLKCIAATGEVSPSIPTLREARVEGIEAALEELAQPLLTKEQDKNENNDDDDAAADEWETTKKRGGNNNNKGLEIVNGEDDISPVFVGDVHGFAAAGILLWRAKREKGAISLEFFVISEFRKGETKRNFIGGKRDAIYESPIDTSVREVDEETGFVMSDEQRKTLSSSLSQIMWVAEAKYFLLIPNAPFDVDQNWINKANDREEAKAKNMTLEYVSEDMMNSNNFLHPFARSMWYSMKKYKVVNKIRQLAEISALTGQLGAASLNSFEQDI